MLAVMAGRWIVKQSGVCCEARRSSGSGTSPQLVMALVPGADMPMTPKTGHRCATSVQMQLFATFCFPFPP